MEGISLKSIILGFIAGAIAMVSVHEGVRFLLIDAGLLASTPAPWSLEPSPTTGFPSLAMDAAWGALWGGLIAIVLGNEPKGSMTLRGALLGILGPAIVGILVVLPLLAGNSPIDATRDINVVGAILLLGAVFGAATAWIYGLLSYGRLP